MDRDPRYLPVSLLIKSKEITTFRDIFTGSRFPRSAIAKLLGRDNNRMRELVENPGQLTVEQVAVLAEYFDVSFVQMERLISEQMGYRKKRKD